MTNEKIKRMFDAFYQAKRIRDMLPHCLRGDAILHTVSGCDPFSAAGKKGISGSLISVMP